MKYDVTLKELFQQLPKRLLQMLIGADVVELLTVEYPTVSIRRADLVVRLSNGRIYHLELQSTNDENMVLRMLEYYIYIKRYQGQAPIQQVLFVGNGKMSMSAGIDDEMLTYRYQMIDIRQLDGEQLLESDSLEDNLFAILCRLDEVATAVKRIIGKIAKLTGKNRTDALAKLLIIAGLRDCQGLVKEEAKEMSIILDIEQNAFLKEVFQEGEQKGIEAGLKEGIEAGLKEGIEAGLREGIKDTLVVRFETVPETIIVAIDKIVELAKLREAHRKAVILATLAEFQEYLSVKG